MTALLTVIGLTLLVSAVCSLLEATLYSTRVASLEAARDQGRHVSGAKQFLRLKRNIGIPTSAILILNTVANTTGATVAGMMAAEALGAQYISLFSAGLTLAILLLAEILPKTYGATHWRTLWPLVVWPLLGLEKVLRPLIWVTQSFAALFTGKTEAPATTEDEIVAMIRMGANAGELSANELQLLTSVFLFDDAHARDVMFPRHEAVFFDVSWDLKRCIDTVIKTGHTRYPLCEVSLESVMGLVHVKDLFAEVGKENVDLRSLARPLERVPESMPLRTLFEGMRKAKPMAAVVDELGTVGGFATLENALEQLVGAVQDEFDQEVPDIVHEAQGACVVTGSLTLHRINVELDLNLSHPEASTISGLVVAALGRLPTPGDTASFKGARAEVLEVDDDRATRLRLQVLDDSENP